MNMHRRHQVRFEYPPSVKGLARALTRQWSCYLVARTLRIPASSIYRWTSASGRAEPALAEAAIEQLVLDCESAGFFYREPLRTRGIAIASGDCAQHSTAHTQFAERAASLSAKPVPVRLQEARRFVDAFYFRTISCAQLAAHAGMSKFHFIKAFSQHFGVTPHRYLLQTRLAHARRLLDLGHESLHAIAVATGFNGISPFTKAFRSLHGQTISAYLRCGTRGYVAGQIRDRAFPGRNEGDGMRMGERNS